jgi:hypothetical protein
MENILTQPDPLYYAMREQWDRDVAETRSQGRIADWMGEPRPLDKSLARVLNWSYENGCFEWTPSPSHNNRKMTAAFGFNSPINANEAVTRCIRMGLIEAHASKGAIRYQMTHAGEYALDEWQIEAEVMGLDVCEMMKGKELPDDDIGGIFG